MAKILHKGIEGLLKILKAGIQGKNPVFSELPPKSELHQYLTENRADPFDVVVIGAGVINPVPLVQQVHAEDKSLAVVVVADPESYASVKQQVQFAPFIGSNVKVVENKAIAGVIDEIEDAVKRTQQRRKYSRLNFETKRIEATLTAIEPLRQQYMDKFLELAPVGAVLLDNDLQVVAVNRQGSVFFSVEGEMAGMNFIDLLPGDLQDTVRQFIREESMNTESVVRTIVIPKGGSKLFLDILVSKDFQLDVTGYSLVIMLDVTERIRWEEELSNNEERLRMAIEAGELGTWDYNLISGELDWDARCKGLFGLSPEKKIDYDIFLKALHPEDHEHVLYEMQKALEGQNGGYFDTQYRVIGIEDKITRWIRAKGRVFFNEDNVAVRFIGMVMDITEVVRSRNILEESIAQKNEFISIASHELKTPITSLKAYMQLVNEKIKGPGDASTINYVKKVIAQIDKLNVLVSELLDLSKLEAGKLQLSVQEFNFDQMVEESISMLQPSLETHKIIKEGNAGVQVVGDKQRLEQVLMNYLTNAVKYSPGKNKILVNVTQQNDNVIVAITDQGIGIPKEKVSCIFERFYRVEGIVHRFQGFGIGLYIASEIIKRHNGKVWLESEENKGSTFYFSIPLKQS